VNCEKGLSTLATGSRNEKTNYSGRKKMLEPRAYQRTNGELAALLATFYETAGAPATWSPIVKSVMASCGATVGLIVSHDYETGGGRIEYAENISGDLVLSYNSHHATTNIWLRREEIFCKADGVVTGEEVVSLDEMKASAFFRDWLRPAGIFHTAWSVLARKGKRLVCAGFGRPPSHKAFEPQELAVIAQMMPHLRGIMQLRSLVGETNLSQYILMEMMGALSVGVALLDGDCQIIEANRIAAGWLAKGNDVRLRADGSGSVHNGLKSNLQSLLKSAIDSSGERRMAVMRSDDPEPVTLILASLQDSGGVFGQSRCGAVLVISDPEYRCRIREDQLVKFYGFTPTEAKLARLISNGYRLEEASKRMGIGYQTARTHLKRIFSKTGVDRQSELVRLLLTGPASFRLPTNAAEGWLDMHCDENGDVHTRSHA
jgi:DNA-binding CsgD family transcriptional regulator